MGTGPWPCRNQPETALSVATRIRARLPPVDSSILGRRKSGCRIFCVSYLMLNLSPHLTLILASRAGLPLAVSASRAELSLAVAAASDAGLPLVVPASRAGLPLAAPVSRAELSLAVAAASDAGLPLAVAASRADLPLEVPASRADLPLEVPASRAELPLAVAAALDAALQLAPAAAPDAELPLAVAAAFDSAAALRRLAADIDNSGFAIPAAALQADIDSLNIAAGTRVAGPARVQRCDSSCPIRCDASPIHCPSGHPSAAAHPKPTHESRQALPGNSAPGRA